jgi:hypothetical protein
VALTVVSAAAGTIDELFGDGYAVTSSDPSDPTAATISQVATDGTRTPLVEDHNIRAAGVDHANIYWVSGDDQRGYEVMAVPKSGGSPQKLAHTNHVPSSLHLVPN